jgi:hypothetical protein
MDRPRDPMKDPLRVTVVSKLRYRPETKIAPKSVHLTRQFLLVDVMRGCRALAAVAPFVGASP